MKLHKIIESKDLINKLLIDKGFKRKGNCWIKSKGEIIQIFEMQVESFIGKHFFNLGIFDEKTDFMCWGFQREAIVFSAACPISLRAGMLIDGRDRLWDNNDKKEDLEEKELVLAQAVIFFESMQCRQNMIEWLTSKNETFFYWYPFICTGILQKLEGQDELSRLTFEKFSLKFANTGLLERLSEVKVRLETN